MNSGIALTSCRVSLKQRNAPISVGQTVRIPIPSVDRAKTDPRNLLGVVMEEEDGFYRIGTDHGILSQQYATKSSQVRRNSSPRKTSRTRKFRYALQWELIRSVAVKDISIAIACKDVKLENATAGLLDASAIVDATIAPVALTNNFLFILFFM